MGREEGRGRSGESENGKEKETSIGFLSYGPQQGIEPANCLSQDDAVYNTYL